MTGKDERGRFTPRNGYASAGGKARAARLTPERRRAIARAGWLALVSRYFAGDAAAAGAWFGAWGAWVSDQVYRDRFPVFAPPHPLRREVEP
jgi:hypothetical protein